jgi:hypothetical protein
VGVLLTSRKRSGSVSPERVLLQALLPREGAK